MVDLEGTFGSEAEFYEIDPTDTKHYEQFEEKRIMDDNTAVSPKEDTPNEEK